MIKKALIMDVDTGIDDAVALVFGAHLKNLDLQLVTTVSGNTNLKNVVYNTLLILEDAKAKVDVVSGEEESLSDFKFNLSVHGKNGLAEYNHQISSKPIKKDYITAMHEVIQKNDITNIIACGPLTNLAKFIQVHPEDNDKIQLILVTGQLDVDENNPYLNFNIRKDLLAFEIVLEKYKNIVFVPSDMGHISYIPNEDFHLTAKTGRMGKILADLYPFHLDRTVKNGAAMHDLCGVLWLSNPEIFNTVQAGYELKRVENGIYLKFDTNAKNKNILLTTSVNVDKLHNIYYSTLKEIK